MRARGSLLTTITHRIWMVRIRQNSCLLF
jgi:hypothetical protein